MSCKLCRNETVIEGDPCPRCDERKLHTFLLVTTTAATSICLLIWCLKHWFL